MSNNSNNHSDQSSGFFYRKDVILWILRIFYLCCFALLVVDFIIHRHTETAVEKIPTFYAFYGFVACSILVFISKLMRIFLIRDENYYDEPEAPEDYLNNQELKHPTSEYPDQSSKSTSLDMEKSS